MRGLLVSNKGIAGLKAAWDFLGQSGFDSS